MNKIIILALVPILSFFATIAISAQMEKQTQFEEEIRIDRCMNWHGTMPRDVAIGYCKVK